MSQDRTPTGSTGEENAEGGARHLRDGDMARYWLAAIIESADDAIISKTLDGLITSWNKAAERIFGYTAEEVIGKPTTILASPEYLGEEEEILARIQRGEHVGHYETVRRHKDGRRIDISLSVSPIRDAGGNVIGVSKIVRDITEARQAKESLRETEHRFMMFMQNLPGLAWIKDARGGYVYVNDAAEAAFRRPRAELYGKTDEEVFPPATAAQFRENDRLALAAGNGIQTVEALKHDDGVHYSIVSKFPIFGADGQAAMIGGVAFDITQHRQAEARLTLLAEISELTRKAESPNDLLFAIARAVGEHLQVRRCLFNEIDLEHDLETVHRDYCRGVESVAGLHRISDYSPVSSAEMCAGETVINYDSQIDPRTAALYEQTYAPNGERAYVAVPLMREGRWVASLWVSDDHPRRWSEQEVGLLEAVAERTWLAVEKLHGERALRESEAHFRGLADAMPQLVWTARPDGVVEYYNTRAREYGGLSPRADQTWEWQPIVHEEDLEVTVNAWRSAVQTGNTYQCEHRIRMADGSFRWHLSRAVPMRDDNGEIVKWFGTATDIEDLRRAEQELRQSEERFRLAAEAVNGIIYDINFVADRVERTRGFFEVLGYRPDEAPTTTNWWLEQMHPDDLPRVMEETERQLASNAHEFRYEYRIRHKDGRWIHLMDRSIVRRDDSGKVVRQVGCAQDITQMREAERALKEADRRKDEFLAMLAHELRNPLAPIRNAAQVLKLIGPRDANQQWAREVIERQTQHLTRLVDDLLDVSRITRGKISLAREPLDLATIINRAVETSRPLIDACHHQLTVTLTPEPVRLEGDLTRLVQVVSNLLSNAAKYTDEGGHIWLEATQEGNEALIRVRDNGMGLPADLLPHVFDLFTQADRSLDRSQGGLGIGLTLVRQLVELHGGHAEASSKGPGQGSEFLVRLPATAPATAEVRESAGESAGPALHALKVLVVEDNVDSAEMMAFMLKLGGHEVRLAHNGPEALEAAHVFEPQAVLCDIGLPGMNGYEVAARLREREAFKQVPLIALTGYGQEEDRRRAKEAGFNYHLIKPVEPEALAALLNSLRSALG